MRNGIDFVADWLIWTNGMRLQTLEETRNWEGPRTYVFKNGDEFVKIEVK